MTVPGIVTNITNFGAFVDIGVKQDGLVHISQLGNSFISDPNQVVKLQQKVMVTITEVDVARKRIALTMKDQSKPARREEGPKREQGAKDKPPVVSNKQLVKEKDKKPAAKAEPMNAFQAKLMELKKKFND